MKVLVSAIDDQAGNIETVVSELNFDRDTGRFWMRCVMGDDWFQRVTSSLPYEPRIVRFVDNVMFVVFDRRSEVAGFSSWLTEAMAAVDYGYRTMRG